MVRLLTLAILPILALGGDQRLQTTTWSGRLPEGWRGLTVLDTSRTPLFLVDSGDRVLACTLHSGKYMTKYSLPQLGASLAFRGDSARPCGFSLAGDIDDDGIREFVASVNQTINKYKVIDGTLALTSVASIRLHADSGRMWITDGCIGDINNDRSNEILVAATGSRPPSAGGDSWSPVTLFVCRWDKDTLVQLWNDGGTLKLEQPDLYLPSEEMCAVADPRNTGANRLILLEAHGDDVHSAEFRVVVWRNGRLEDDGSFELRRGVLEWNNYNGDAFRAATGCRFGHVRGKTAILADIFDGDMGNEELFIFSGDSATQHIILWPGAQTAFFADIDGKGVGIIRRPDPDGGEAEIEFYRL